MEFSESPLLYGLLHSFPSVTYCSLVQRTLHNRKVNTPVDRTSTTDLKVGLIEKHNLFQVGKKKEHTKNYLQTYTENHDFSFLPESALTFAEADEDN